MTSTRSTGCSRLWAALRLIRGRSILCFMLICDVLCCVLYLLSPTSPPPLTFHIEGIYYYLLKNLFPTFAFQGLDDLPDYKKVSFPTLLPVDLKILVPHAEPSDIAFLCTLLCLDPSKRATAQAARDCPYFREYPLPAPLSELSIPSRGSNVTGTGSVHLNSKEERLLKKGSDVEAYLKSFLL
jgi:serine/threonine protein kinase